MPRMTGRVIAGRYALSAPIGRGAMGVVWRAHDHLLDREVAVKEVVLSAAIGEDEQRNAYQRTLREARTAARLSHRGVVTIYDVAEEEGRPFIVMELVPSQSLDQVVAAEGPMTPLRAGRMGQQLLAALATAHAAGVLHRDVKPSNVLIANDRSGGGWDERAVLTDFGIAQFEGDPRLTQTGMVMGSPGFTAPERIRGGDATPASDLWSLGATIYTAVEGQGPYEQRGGAITTMSAIINEDAPVAPSAGRLGPLIAALLRREPSARPTAAAAARMFTEVLPLLPDISTHPATVRSAYVPVPAAPAASVVAGDVKESALDAAAAGAASADAVSAADAAVPVEGAAVDAVAVGAAAVAASPAPAAASPAPEPSVPSAASVAEAAAGGLVMTDAGASAAAAEDGDRPDAHAAEALPAAAPADSKLASAPAPTQRPVPLPPPLSLQPKPTFTASKGNQSAAPGVSAPRSPSPAPAVPAQPAPLFSAGRPARPDPPTMPEPAQYYGRSATHAPASGGPYAGGQFAGPSQDYPGLAQQYAPGTGGKPRRSRRGRRIALVVGAIVVAAAAGGGAALALNHENNAGASTTNTTNAASLQNQPPSVQALDTPSTTVPPGFTPVTVSPSAAGTTAGFSIDVPSSWTETRDGLLTKFNDDNGDRFLEVDLTAHTYTNMVNEAEFIEKEQVAVGTFPGYKRVALKAARVRGTSGAFWQFTWDRYGVTTRTDDILFMAQTSNGQQSYAIYFRAPNSGWGSKFLPQFEKMLSTFQVAAS
jgi:tRNA A-37 threonylcarbamoyl transferase component Bud32